MASEPRIFYFGCLEQAGHYVWQSDSPPEWLDKNDPLRHPIEIRDGELPPQQVECVEGRVASHNIFGFTVVAWWDNSVDSRGSSNSAFWVKGRHEPEEALRLGLARFPTVAARITYPLTLDKRSV